MKKRFLMPLTCATTAVAALTPLSALTSCGNSQYDKISQTLYKSLITEFVGSELAKEIVGDSVDTGIAGITSIPRPSGSLDGIRNYIKDRLNQIDIGEANIHDNLNIITEEKDKKYSSLWFDIPASNDGQNLPKVILQAHMDLVFAFDKQRFHDTYTDHPDDPIATDWVIDPIYDSGNNSIHTKNYCTSLGADNGIGVATMLAIAKHRSDEGFKHGPIRCIITADEEEGMKGANVLSCGKLCVDDVELLENQTLSNIIDSPYLINLDCETIGEIVTSCAGGIGSHYKQNFEVVSAQPDSAPIYNQYEIEISGLKGGHSGVDINNWHANAIKMAGEIIDYCDTNGLVLINMTTPGIEAYNSIPDKCYFTFGAPIELEHVQDACTYSKTAACRIYQGEVFDDIEITITPIEDSKKYQNAIDFSDSEAIYLLIHKLWYGPYSWIDPEMKIVKTSANVGPVQLTVDQDISARGKHLGCFSLSTYSRSQDTKDVEYFRAQNAIYSHFFLGKEVKYDTPPIEPKDTYTIDTVYPGWEKGVGTKKLHDLAIKGFKSFGVKTKDIDIHGGVEAAWWSDVYTTLADDADYKDVYKDWAVTSMGPTIKFCHNPKEEVYLNSVSTLMKTILYTFDHIVD